MSRPPPGMPSRPPGQAELGTCGGGFCLHLEVPARPRVLGGRVTGSARLSQPRCLLWERSRQALGSTSSEGFLPWPHQFIGFPSPVSLLEHSHPPLSSLATPYSFLWSQLRGHFLPEAFCVPLVWVAVLPPRVAVLPLNSKFVAIALFRLKHGPGSPGGLCFPHKAWH